MPSEHEDDRARQIEALRQYMNELASQRERATRLGVGRELPTVEPAGPPERRRPPLAWLLVTGLLVVVALVGGVFVGAVAWSDDRPARGAAGLTGAAPARPSPGRTTVAAVATPACKTAVDRANAMLASAVKLRGALAEHDRILNDPANRGLSGGELLQKLAVSQQAGSSESARFDRALDDYRQVVDQCDLRVP